VVSLQTEEIEIITEEEGNLWVMEALSHEIILHILSFLQPDHLKIISRVNKEFLYLSEDISLWISLATLGGIPFKRNNVTYNWDSEVDVMVDVESEADEVIREKCLDEYILERNWEKNNFRLQTLKGHYGDIRAVSYDEDILLSGGEDNTVKVWSIHSGKCLRDLHGHRGWIYSLKYRKGLGVTASQDRTIKVWIIESPQFRPNCVATLTGHTRAVVAVDFDESRIYSGSGDKTVKVWDANGGQLIHSFEHGNSVMALNNVNDCLVSADADHGIKVWDLRVAQCVLTFTDHDGINALKIDESRRRIYSGGNDLSIRVLDLGTGLCSHSVRGHKWNLASLDFVENKLVSSAGDYTMKVWDLDTFMCKHTITGNSTCPVVCLQVDRKKIVSCNYKEINIYHYGKYVKV